MAALPNPEKMMPADNVKADAAKQPAEGDEKISPAEAKKRAKAEKQARRAAEKEARGGNVDSPVPSAANGRITSEPETPKQRGQQQKPKQQQQQQQQVQAQAQSHPKGQQKSGQEAQTPGGSQSQLPLRARGASQSMPREKKQENKNVELFSHLYSQPRRANIDGTSKDVHPSVVALGFQIANYKICGGVARCVGMLNAFKDAIQEYHTPAGTSLARHMTSHHLSPQIDYLKSCRPLSESMGNAIRWLKKLIAEVDPSTPDQEAKDYLCDSIDRFIQERITITDQAIASSASQLIKNGSVVLTYAKSSIVEKTIMKALADGKQFRVVCVDSRPLFEGKNLAMSLVRAGLQVDYLSFSGLSRAVADANIVLLGAHSMLSNGRMMSRVGSAAVAMAAHRADIPVIVCCESVKFSGKVALDSIVLNEVAPPEELLFSEPKLYAPPPAASTPGGKPGGKDEEEDEPRPKTLNDWRGIPNLQILNLMYDVTPAEYIRMVICEYGSVPPSSVPVVHRLANEGE